MARRTSDMSSVDCPIPPAPDIGAMQWQTLLDQTTTPMALLDPEGRCLHVNEALCSLAGYDRACLLRHGLGALDCSAADAETLTGGAGAPSVEKGLRRSDGAIIWVRRYTSVINDSDHRRVLLAQFEEISDPRESAMLWSRAFGSAPVGMALLDLNGDWTAVNDAWCELLGYTRDEMLSMRCSDATYAVDPESEAAALADLVAGRVGSVSLKKRYRHKDGHPLWALVRTSVVPGADDRPMYLVSQYEALSERCMTDTTLAHLALHDPLTGLANRALFADRLEHGLAQLRRNGGVVTVLVADLDELKPVNDRYGHAVGDQLLIATADELLNGVSPDDTVARIGGDEFAVVSHLPDVAAAEVLRDRIRQRLRTERVIAGHRVTLRASVGLAITQNPDTAPDDLVHCADRNMYSLKNRHAPR
ncbi:hypothetical protein GCM10010470_46210 [Saccharopolyspora taberi]|uniref:Diguanylate cyclase n=1 Tax=Saccharopolyspora taberi TaxID=60895 RepID=A0ABN3VHY8_9PSEU